MINKNVLVDTGFWYAIYDEKDQYHDVAVDIYELIKDMNLIIPWPTCYEVLRTSFVRNELRVTSFTNDLKKMNKVLLDDIEYKDKALNSLLDLKARNYKFELYSLVDSVLNEILIDINVKLDYFVTFNSKDFYQQCERRKLEMISE